MILALMIRPGEHPKQIYLCEDLLSLKIALGIEEEMESDVSVLPLDGRAIVLFHRDSMWYGGKGNRRIGEDIITGTLYIVGVEKGELVSLSRKELKQYAKRFWDPEEFTHDDLIDNWLADLQRELDVKQTVNPWF